jgi:hypothetical protein
VNEVSGANLTEVSTNNATWTAVSGTSHTFTLVDGTHTVYVRIKDQVGLVGTDSVTFTIDTLSPTAEISPTGDDLGLDSIVVVEFSELMNATSVSVVVDGVTGNITWNGTVLTFTPSTLAYATDYLVTVSGKDLAGNPLEINWTFRTTAGTGSLIGTIVDENGDPIANVTVHIGDRTAVTNELGRFVLNDLAPGNYVLTVDEEGFDVYTDPVAVTVGEANELGDLTLVAEEIEEEDDGGDNTLQIIIAVVAIIAVIGVVAVVLLKRKP